MSAAHLPPATRLHEIDGLRGWAALSVMLYHFYQELFVKIWPEVDGLLPRLILHGPLSVAVFFVLSGDALSSACLAGGRRTLDAMLVKRYLRLTLPILVSCALVWALMRLGLTWHVQAGQIVAQPVWLGGTLALEPTLASLVHHAFYGVYVSHQASTSYNPFLWTMSIELVGSLLVFAFLYVRERLRHPGRVLLAVCLLAWVFKSMYGLFFVGVLLALWRHEGGWRRWQGRPACRWGAPVLLGLCVWLDAAQPWPTGLAPYLNLALAPLLVLSLYAMPGCVAFLSSRLSRFLGDVSFSLYLVHFAVLVSLASWLVLAWQQQGRLSQAHMLHIATLASLASLVAATVLWRLEARMLRWLARLPGWVLKPEA